MLQQPMKEKLHALKLQGMIEALECQEQDEMTRGLSFLDRLALLVDQQWNWRQNQALTRRVLAARLRGAAWVENIDYRAERGLSRSVVRAVLPTPSGLTPQSGGLQSPQKRCERGIRTRISGHLLFLWVKHLMEIAAARAESWT
jgi:hypothetical protein